MTHPLEMEDFRAMRHVLAPSDFALGSDEPEPSPTDLIPEEAWHGIMDLPDDVAIRTTSHQGTRVAILYDLWSAWVDVFPLDGPIGGGMLDAADDFAAALFNLVHGFYKQATASLRNALEVMTFACACEATGGRDTWEGWTRGKKEVQYKKYSRELRESGRFAKLEADAGKKTGACLLCDGNIKEKVWSTDLYSRLSSFSHARGNTANTQLWNSNGPIYSAEGMRISYRSFLETYALISLISHISLGRSEPPSDIRFIFERENVQQYAPEQFQTLCEYYASRMFRPR